MFIRVNYEKAIILITIQNSLIVKLQNIFLVFGIIRTASSSGYKNIILIFALVRTALFNFSLLVYIKLLIVKL